MRKENFVANGVWHQNCLFLIWCGLSPVQVLGYITQFLAPPVELMPVNYLQLGSFPLIIFKISGEDYSTLLIKDAHTHRFTQLHRNGRIYTLT